MRGRGAGLLALAALASGGVVSSVVVVPAPVAAAENLLTNAGFETEASEGDGGLPLGWELTVGASHGLGPGQDAGLATPGRGGRGRAFAVEADAETQRFFALESRPVSVRPGDSFLLSGWMRGEGVVPEGRQFENCGLFLRALDASGATMPFGGGAVVSTRPLSGTFDWRRVERRVEPPFGAAAVRVGAFCSTSGSVRWDDVALERIPTVRGGSVALHVIEDDPKRAADLLRVAEASLARAESSTGMPWPDDEVVHVHLHPDVAAKERATGKGGNAHVELPNVVHVVPEALGSPHEFVHLLAAHHLNPDPPALLGEGLAVAAGGHWRGAELDDAVAAIEARGMLPRLGVLFPTAVFRQIPEDVSYPVAGSFVTFLVAACGADGFAVLYRTTATGDHLSDVAEVVPVACDGHELSDLERAWAAAVVAHAEALRAQGVFGGH